MNKEWKAEKLGKFIYQDSESAVAVNPSETYEMVGVYSFGRGLFVKAAVNGIDTSYKTFYKLKAEHIVMSQLFGWEGAIALSSDKFGGKFVSSQFPTFLVYENEVDRRFIGYFLIKRDVWKKLYEIGKGMGSRRRTLNPANLYSLDFQYPPLAEQKRIVAIIESLNEAISKINETRIAQQKEIDNLYYSLHKDLEEKYPKITIGKILFPKELQVNIELDKIYKQVTAKWWNKGVVLRNEKIGQEIKSKQFLVEKGNFIISKIDARHGAYGIVPEELDNAVVTGDFPVFEISNINPYYFDFITKTDYFQHELKIKSQGSTRRVRLDMNKFMNIEIPYPSPEEQNTIVDLIQILNLVQEYHHKNKLELEELLPSVIDKAFRGEL